MNPYKKELKNIKDISSYFKKNDDYSVNFIGNTLELRIPMKFKSHGSLLISETVITPGIMDMIFDDEYHVGLNILASITIVPSDISKMTYDGLEYLVLYLKKGDTFMTSYRVLQDASIIYVLWTEFITYGGVPYWIDYEGLLRLFENVKELTGSGIGASRSVFESIVAHISRDNINTLLQYRLTDMKTPMKLIALNSVSQAPTGTIARLNGSYFKDDGLTSALRYQVDQQQPFENLLRGIPNNINDNVSTE